MQKRAFLKGGLAALGGFGLMGAASAANPAAGNIPAAKDIKWDEEFDTIIVGSGVAATCAGNEALDQGLKKVIMVEKMPVYGGNSAITGFWINIPRSPEQLKHGVTDDSPELFLKDTLKAGEGFNDPALAKALCFNALDAYNYYTNKQILHVQRLLRRPLHLKWFIFNAKMRHLIMLEICKASIYGIIPL